jgi:4-hydroxysphinganine ceramide fatty acyl 2-hydroxylase
MASSSDLRRIALLLLVESGLVTACQLTGASLATCALYGGAGLFAWTFVEYLLHRFLFHLPPGHPLAFAGARMHHDHHVDPSRGPVVKPPALTLAAFAATFAVAVASLGMARAAPLWSGLIAGYLVYELSHLAAHRLGEERHPWPAQRRRHLRHHDDASLGFGISSPLWDRVLGTGHR